MFHSIVPIQNAFNAIPFEVSFKLKKITYNLFTECRLYELLLQILINFVLSLGTRPCWPIRDRRSSQVVKIIPLLPVRIIMYIFSKYGLLKLSALCEILPV